MKLFKLGFLILIVSCANVEIEKKIEPIAELKDAKSEIAQIMTLQQNAWNQGSLEDFMKPYWQNDSLAFMGKRGILYGYQNTLNMYEKSYPTKEAMGTLLFKNKTFTPLGPEFYHINGQWTLFRTEDTLSGHYSLIWQKINDQWFIINDHSS